MCDGGGQASGSQRPEEETRNSAGVRERERVDDVGGLHTGWWPRSTDTGVMAESADLRFPQGGKE